MKNKQKQDQLPSFALLFIILAILQCACYIITIFEALEGSGRCVHVAE